MEVNITTYTNIGDRTRRVELREAIQRAVGSGEAHDRINNVVDMMSMMLEIGVKNGMFSADDVVTILEYGKSDSDIQFSTPA